MQSCARKRMLQNYILRIRGNGNSSRFTAFVIINNRYGNIGGSRVIVLNCQRDIENFVNRQIVIGQNGFYYLHFAVCLQCLSTNGIYANTFRRNRTNNGRCRFVRFQAVGYEYDLCALGIIEHTVGISECRRNIRCRCVERSRFFKRCRKILIVSVREVVCQRDDILLIEAENDNSQFIGLRIGNGNDVVDVIIFQFLFFFCTV